MFSLVFHSRESISTHRLPLKRTRIFNRYAVRWIQAQVYQRFQSKQDQKDGIFSPTLNTSYMNFSIMPLQLQMPHFDVRIRDWRWILVVFRCSFGNRARSFQAQLRYARLVGPIPMYKCMNLPLSSFVSLRVNNGFAICRIRKERESYESERGKMDDERKCLIRPKLFCFNSWQVTSSRCRSHRPNHNGHFHNYPSTSATTPSLAHTVNIEYVWTWLSYCFAKIYSILFFLRKIVYITYCWSPCSLKLIMAE